MNIRCSLCIAAVLSLVAVSNSSALEVSLGVKGGLELSKLHGAEMVTDVMEEYDPYEYQVLKPGFTFGAALQLKLAKMFAIQPEMFFSPKGQKSADGDDYIIYKLNYLEIPVLFELLIPAGVVTPTLFAGPSVAFKLGKINGKQKSGGEVIEMTEEEREYFDKYINGFDFGIALGGGIGIKAGPGNFIIDIRYTLGLSKIYKNFDENEDYENEDYDNEDYEATDLEMPKDKNTAISFEIGYMFTF